MLSHKMFCLILLIILLRIHTIHDVQRLSRHQKCETQKHHLSRYGTASVTLLDSIVTQHVMKYLDQQVVNLTVFIILLCKEYIYHHFILFQILIGKSS